MNRRLSAFDRAWLRDQRATRRSWHAVQSHVRTVASVDYHDRHLHDVVERLARLELAAAKARAA